ncbi:HNH endonuclease [Mesorhizobium sp. M0047]|uniref:HNH endonuclease n=1 Tax=Mesorhizobium sp. M0047 TaxID=2956859 RepID=UPI0033384319
MCKSNTLAKLRIAQADKQNWLCFYCDFPMWDGDSAAFSERYHLSIGLLDRFLCTAEHLTPRMDGGEDAQENVVAACKFCNQTRHRMRSVLSPAAYRRYVRRRIAARKWHPPECRHLLKWRSGGPPEVSRPLRTSDKASPLSVIQLSNGN